MFRAITLAFLILSVVLCCASRRERSSSAQFAGPVPNSGRGVISTDPEQQTLARSSEIKHAETPVQPASFQNEDAARATYSISDLENLALANNPTIAELVATTQKAAGFRTQVALRANPVMGYNGTQIADEGTDQHTIFIQQTIITADKRDLNRRVLNEALRAQLFQLEAQKYRVATDVRIRFYDALAAQQRVDLVREFQAVVNQGLELAEQRKNANEGSRLEVVQAKQQQAEAQLALEQAEATYFAAWRELTAFVGCPELGTGELTGELPTSTEARSWSELAAETIAESPEYEVARAKLAQAQANVQRQNVQAIPNLDVNIASGVDNGTNSGLINVQVGAPIPVFNKNQGNIAAARAEYARASQEVERIENSIKARIAAASRDYDVSRAAVEKYQSQILPYAQEALELAELAYKAGETSFVQVLIARRAFLDSSLQLIAAQVVFAQSQSRLDGYVLSGGLDLIIDDSGDDSLRGLTFSQQ